VPSGLDVVIPSLDTTYPVRQSPHYRQAKADLIAWTSRFGVFPDDAAAERFAEADFPYLLSLCVPHTVDVHKLTLAAAYIGLFTVFDDIVESGGEPDAYVARMLSCVRQERVPDALPLELFLQDLCAQMRAQMTDAQWAVCAEETRRWIEEILPLSRKSIGNSQMSVEQYLESRLLDLGTYSFYPVIETCLDIDLCQFARHPLLCKVHYWNNAVILLQDDLVSFRKEYDSPDRKNLVLLFHYGRGYPLQEAVNETHRLYLSFLENFETACRRIEDEPFEHRGDLDRYLDELRFFLSGMALWFQESCRYTLTEKSTWRPLEDTGSDQAGLAAPAPSTS
jgi:hypothetical protein